MKCSGICRAKQAQQGRIGISGQINTVFAAHPGTQKALPLKFS